MNFVFFPYNHLQDHVYECLRVVDKLFEPLHKYLQHKYQRKIDNSYPLTSRKSSLVKTASAGF